MGIIDFNVKDFFKQSGFALLILGIVVLMIFKCNSQRDEKLAYEQLEKKYSVGKIYKIYSGKNYVKAKYFFYFNGKREVAEEDIPVYDASLIGKLCCISYPINRPNDFKLDPDSEVKDTIMIQEAGFTLKTKYKFDYSIGKYIPYKEFE